MSHPLRSQLAQVALRDSQEYAETQAPGFSPGYLEPPPGHATRYMYSVRSELKAQPQAFCDDYVLYTRSTEGLIYIMEWVLSILAHTGMGIEEKNVVLLLNSKLPLYATAPAPQIPSYNRNTGCIRPIKLKLLQMEAGPTKANLSSNPASQEKLLGVIFEATVPSKRQIQNKITTNRKLIHRVRGTKPSVAGFRRTLQAAIIPGLVGYAPLLNEITSEQLSAMGTLVSTTARHVSGAASTTPRSAAYAHQRHAGSQMSCHMNELLAGKAREIVNLLNNPNYEGKLARASLQDTLREPPSRRQGSTMISRNIDFLASMSYRIALTSEILVDRALAQIQSWQGHVADTFTHVRHDERQRQMKNNLLYSPVGEIAHLIRVHLRKQPEASSTWTTPMTRDDEEDALQKSLGEDLSQDIRTALHLGRQQAYKDWRLFATAIGIPIHQYSNEVATNLTEEYAEDRAFDLNQHPHFDRRLRLVINSDVTLGELKKWRDEHPAT